MRNSRSIAIVAIAVVVIGGGIYAIGRYAARSGYGQVDRALALPRIGDHWHADLRVVICGVERKPVVEGPGDVHSHGDGKIHSHPHSVSTAYAAANVGLFFRTHGGVFSKEEVRYPGEDRTWRVGESCAAGTVPGRTGPAGLQFRVNDKDRTDFDRYVPQDGDTIEIRFE